MSGLVADGIEQATARAFIDDMEAMKLGEFVARFCAMDKKHQILAVRIYDTTFSTLEAEDRQTLLRMAIIAQSMAAHVAYIVEHGELRSVDDEWESTAILRFLHYLRTRFPTTKSLLDEAYMTRMDKQFQKALNHVKKREQEEDHKISNARDRITELEKQKTELLDAIEGIKEERLKFRGMRQELEAHTR